MRPRALGTGRWRATRAAMHGEQVGLGSLVSTAAHESPLLGALAELYARLDLPMHPSQLSIAAEDMVRAVQGAPGTRPGRSTVLSGLDPSDTTVARLLDHAFAAVV